MIDVVIGSYCASNLNYLTVVYSTSTCPKKLYICVMVHILVCKFVFLRNEAGNRTLFFFFIFFLYK